MKHLLLILTILLVPLTVWAQGQTRIINGEVLDENDEPLTGVAVKLEGSNVAVLTDLDGKYAIQIPASGKAVLTISYVGYKNTEIEIAPGQNTVTTNLSPNDNQLEEVVVIGYGTAKKSSLTSSVEVISGEDLMRIPSMNVDGTLAGQVAGLGVMSSTGDPSSAKEAAMSIRGNTGAPLLVIDGVPRLGTNTSDGEMRLSDLNPDDIESISVLNLNYS